MFEEKDYFMKIIEQFAAAIGKIMKLKSENKIAESQEVLDDILEKFTDLHREVLEVLPVEILIQKVSRGRQINTDKCLMFSDLLIHQADIYKLQGEIAKAENLYLKGFNIFMYLIQNDDSVLQQHQSKIDDIIAKGRLVDAPKQSKLLLFKYYELTRNYAKAEDVLFDLLADSKPSNDLLAKGIEFYERLMNKDQTELERGNLPIEEVLEGLADLKELSNKD